jgi:hypothetical protein
MPWTLLQPRLTAALRGWAARQAAQTKLAAAVQTEMQAGSETGATAVALYAAAAQQYAAAIAVDPACAEALLRAGWLARSQACTQAQLGAAAGQLQAAVVAAGAQLAPDAVLPVPARAKQVLSDALARLALLDCQGGRDAQAAAWLARLGCRYRLAPGVLCYALPQHSSQQAPMPSPSSQPPQQQQVPPPDAAEYVRALDGALPEQLLADMQTALAPGSRFWREHRRVPAFTHAQPWPQGPGSGGNTGARPCLTHARPRPQGPGSNGQHNQG